jgi:hypothetical protein
MATRSLGRAGSLAPRARDFCLEDLLRVGRQVTLYGTPPALKLARRRRNGCYQSRGVPAVSAGARDGIVAFCPCSVRERGAKRRKAGQLGQRGSQRLLALSCLWLSGLRGGIGLITQKSVVQIHPPQPILSGPARRHGLHNVPVTWVTLLGRTDFRSVGARESPNRSTPNHNP